jgi:hypothetical protein
MTLPQDCPTLVKLQITNMTHFLMPLQYGGNSTEESVIESKTKELIDHDLIQPSASLRRSPTV